MAEIWLVVEVYPVNYAAQRIDLILKLVKPTLESVEKDSLIETFHFLFEPGHLLFRARTSDMEKREKVESIIGENLKKVEYISRVEFKKDYTEEQDQFGTEGWLYVQKLFEYASRISLLKRETFDGLKTLNACHLDNQFNDGKLIHCFLNAQGHSIPEEALFHNQANIERLLRLYGFFDVPNVS
jgi:hypothetical protein